MSSTAHLNLPYLAAGQAQKHVTLNESLRMLDALVQLSVVSRATTVPPAAPAEGARYLLPPSPTGDWAAHGGAVAAWQDGGWNYFEPRAGWLLWVQAEGQLLVFDGSAWHATGGGEMLAKLGLNTTADTTNRLALASPASLFGHDGAGHQLKINKASSGDTGTVLFQTGFSGRAEMGLAGNDDFKIKVSANGASWSEAVSVNAANAMVGVGVATALDRLHIKGNARIQDDGARIMFYDTAGSTRTGYFQAHAPSGFYFVMEVSQPMYFYTANTQRMVIKPDGKVGIGTNTPSVALQVAGGVRVAAYTVAALPSATAAGEGTIVHVSNEVGGSVLAFSDGGNWRRVTDRAIVS
ncbi:MAG TPA: DUF2793 domain-containing protein [Rhabdaerophilum sp.]|nr:DUF2793 domain-containing protein [Rhabdaerophilum sp.]